MYLSKDRSRRCATASESWLFGNFFTNDLIELFYEIHHLLKLDTSQRKILVIEIILKK